MRALTKVSLPQVTVTSATFVATGEMPPPPARGGGPGPAARPIRSPTCRPCAASPRRSVRAPTPTSGWSCGCRPRGTASSRGTGNGGLGGGAGANVNALAAGVRRGYATAGHNTGHEGDSSYALEHPERIKDFGYRATHEMTVTSKALIRAYLRQAAVASYMAEGGGGTIAALSSAQRYPDDYDTIAVTGHVVVPHAPHVRADVDLDGHAPGRRQLPHARQATRVLHDAVLAACDARDGLKDGVVGDPIGCRFDPGTVQCKEGAPAARA